MIGFKKVFVDTAPFIYFIEKDSNNPQYYEKVKAFFKYGYDSDKRFVSSVITMEEYFVFPYRNKAYSLIDMFNRLVATTDMEIVEIVDDWKYGFEAVEQNIKDLKRWMPYSLQQRVCLDVICS